MSRFYRGMGVALSIIMSFNGIPLVAYAKMSEEVAQVQENNYADDSVSDSSEILNTQDGTQDVFEESHAAYDTHDAASDTQAQRERFEFYTDVNASKGDFETVDGSGVVALDIAKGVKKHDETTLRSVVISSLSSRLSDFIDVSSFGMDVESFKTLYTQTVEDNPYLFDAEPYATLMVKNGAISAFRPVYKADLSFGEAQTMRDAFASRLADLMSWVPTNGSTVDKVKAVHDWIVFNVRYDAYHAGNLEWSDVDAYGAVVKGIAVSAGYADLFDVAMRELGIDSRIVSANDHTWNIVNVDGSWYHVDTCWDEAMTEDVIIPPIDICAAFFLKSDDGMIAQDTALVSQQLNSESTVHEGYDTLDHIRCTDGRYDGIDDAGWPMVECRDENNVVASISLSDELLELHRFEVAQIGLELDHPVNVAAAQWQSSDPEIAYVDSSGVVYAGGNTGTAVVSCTIADVTSSARVIVGHGAGSLEDATIAPIPDQLYTGKQITPSVDISIGDTKLVEGMDYELAWTDNVEVGKATVAITGLGAYEGSYRNTSFKIGVRPGTKIEPADDMLLTVQASSFDATLKKTAYTYDGKKKCPAAIVIDSSSGEELEKNVDYKISWANNINVGTAHATIKGIGAHAGMKQILDFTINARSIAAASVKPAKTAYTYSGKALKPSVTVELGDVALVKDTDYTVSYSNNVAAGTATVTVKGKGNYKSSAKVSFTINRKSLSKATVALSTTSYTYNGKARKPAVTVTLNDVALKKDTDYKVTYSGNTNVGTATVTITGKGNYSGSAKQTFKINALSITKVNVAAVADCAYAGSKAEPSIDATYNGATLVSGKDYVLSYANNAGPGNATITITGKGNYKGTRRVDFVILDAQSSSAAHASGNVSVFERYDTNLYDIPRVAALHTNGSGALERVEYVDGELIVESLNGSYGVTGSTRVIPADTYQPSDLASQGNFLWGGFYSGSTYNYVVTGQMNSANDDALKVFRFTKYDKNWKMVAFSEISNDDIEKQDLADFDETLYGTAKPFEVGSCVMSEVGGYLHVRTNQTLYRSMGSHQTNVHFVVEESSMDVVDSMTYWAYLENFDSKYGGVSHSFAQRLCVLDGRVFAADLGDETPRAITIKNIGTVDELDLGEWHGGYWNTGSAAKILSIGSKTYRTDSFGVRKPYGQLTGVSVGGFESSETHGTLLTSYTTIDQSLWSKSGFAVGERTPRVPYVAVTGTMAYDSGNPQSNSLIVKLSDKYDDYNGHLGATLPKLVKVSDDRYCVIWAECECIDASWSGTNQTGTICYAFVDGDGNVIATASEMNGYLGDCDPVLYNGRIVWYAEDVEGGHQPVYYSIDA